MADWFRWWHGSVTDPKFLWVARHSKQRIGDVIMTWAALLEHASQEGERGNIICFDMDAFDCLLGADDGATAQIIYALEQKGMIEGGRLVGWEKRQPKREDAPEAVPSSERVRSFRQRQKEQQAKRDETQCNAMQRDETQCNARGEESREDVNPISEASGVRSSPPATPAGEACARLRKAGVASVNPSHPKLLALLAAGLTADELAGIAAEPNAKGKGFAWILATAEGRRRDAASVTALPNARASPRGGTVSEARREASKILTGRGGQQHERDITGEAERIA